MGYLFFNVLDFMRAVEERLSFLEEKLAVGEADFYFIKKDGSLRKCHGTRCLGMIPEEHHPKGKRGPSPLVFTFFDLEKGLWRCLRRDRIITDKEHLDELLDFMADEQHLFLSKYNQQ